MKITDRNNNEVDPSLITLPIDVEYWQLTSKGKVLVDAAGSHFGGVYLDIGTNDLGQRVRVTQYASQNPVDPDDSRYGVFRDNCFVEIQEIAKKQAETLISEAMQEHLRQWHSV